MPHIPPFPDRKRGAGSSEEKGDTPYTGHNFILRDPFLIMRRIAKNIPVLKSKPGCFPLFLFREQILNGHAGGILLGALFAAAGAAAYNTAVEHDFHVEFLIVIRAALANQNIA